MGRAKVSIEKTDEFEVDTMKEGPRFDGDTLYAIDGYLFFTDELAFEIYRDIYFSLYDIDFVLDYEEVVPNTVYVYEFSYDYKSMGI